MDPKPTKPLGGLCVTPFDFEDLRRALAVVEDRRKAVGVVNPRPPGLHNRALELLKKSIARALDWYTRPLQEFNAAVSRSLTEIYAALEHLSAEKALPQQRELNAAVDRSLKEIYSALEHLSASVVALDEKLGRQQLELLHEQVRALISLESRATEEMPAEAADATREETHIADALDSPEIRLGSDRTAYILGLFGTGRLYLNEIILQHIGVRAKYFRDQLRLYPGPTSMICSGHATVKYVSRAQSPPQITRRIVEAVQVRFADSIFIYRHPLDSLLTNWVYWRTYIRENRTICGISEVYESFDDLCADLDRDFFEFKAFAEGYPDFYAGLDGPRFLSFAEFVEETALHHQSASLTLRLEDFMTDPRKEFSKMTELMSVDLDLSRLRISPPRSKAYGYLVAADKVPRFKAFIDRLNLETKRRIEKVGYSLS